MITRKGIREFQTFGLFESGNVIEKTSVQNLLRK